MWLIERLSPDFKTIADFRKDNVKAIRGVCREFVLLCRRLDLFTEAIVAIDGSKFKAVNNRDKNFTPYVKALALPRTAPSDHEKSGCARTYAWPETHFPKLAQAKLATDG